jgi:hypothetical protein
MREQRSLKVAAFLALFVLPLVLRLAPIEHGMPRNYVPDTNIVRAALGMARDKDLVPRPGKYSHYPNLLPYALLPAFAVQYEAGKLRGEWADAKTYGDHVLEHPEDAQIIGRWLVALLGALTPFVVFKTARAAGMTRGAWIAAWFVATGLLHVQFSTEERPWVPMTLFLALAAWPAVIYARDPRPRWLVLSGLAAALSFSCHQGGLGALGIPALAWIFAPLSWRSRDLAQRLGHGAACVAAFAVLALAVGHPYLLRYGRTQTKDIIGGAQIEEQGGMEIGGMSILFHVRWQSLARLSKAMLGYDPVVVLLGVAGLYRALRRRELRGPTVFTIAWAAFFLTNTSDHVRYLLPVTVLLALPAGLLCESWITHRAGRVALLAALCFPLAQSLRLDHLLRQSDTRESAERELAKLGPHTLVAIDRYGPEVELDRDSLERLERVRTSTHSELRAREEHRRRLLDRGLVPPAERGIDAVRVEELFEIDDRVGTVKVRPGLESLGKDASTVLSSIGATHLLLVERRMHGGEQNLLAPVVAGVSPTLVIDPSCGSGRTSEAFLPTEMDFPLVALWSVNRPGPWMGLYRLH